MFAAVILKCEERGYIDKYSTFSIRAGCVFYVNSEIVWVRGKVDFILIVIIVIIDGLELRRAYL